MTSSSDPAHPDAAHPLDDALAELERQRRDRSIVLALIGLAAIGALALLVAGDVATRLAPWVAGVLLVVTLAYGVWIVVEERQARRVIRTLLLEREHAAATDARVDALAALGATTREVSAAEGALTEVFDRLLAGAQDLTRAGSGAIALRSDDQLMVAAAFGPAAPRRGEILPLDEGVAGAAVTAGEPVRAGRGAPWGGAHHGDASLAAPLRLPDRTVGVLVVVRDATMPAFGEDDEALVSLFAQHAALAVRNAWRLDAERQRALALEARCDALEAELEAQRRVSDERARSAVGIVHDLRSPLAAASGFARLLRERDDRFTPARRQAVLGDLVGELDRARRVIDGLLLVARAEAGLTVDEVVDLAAVARDVGTLGRGVALDRRRSGAIEVDAPGPAPVRGDPVALERVVADLLDNALAHTPPDTDVELSVQREGAAVVLTVVDHGPPVSADDLADAFEPFVRSGSIGDGLGLHVVRTLVEQHGGTVRLDPRPGGGVRAEVVLPTAPTGVGPG